MTLIQGGPPEWVWERPPSLLQWEVAPSQAGNCQLVYELRLNCHLEIMRLQFFTENEIWDLQARDGGGGDDAPARPVEVHGNRSGRIGLVANCPDVVVRDRRGRAKARIANLRHHVEVGCQQA